MTDYYIKTPGDGGNDGNNGTSPSTPWATFGKATSTLIASDTVTAYEGTYSEAATEGTSGSSGNLITYQINSGDTVQIYRFIMNGDYIKIDGFKCDPPGPGNIRGVYVNGDYCEAWNCYIYQAPKKGILVNTDKTDCKIMYNHVEQAGGTGIDMRGTNCLIEGNDVEDIRTSMKGNSGMQPDGFHIFNTGNIYRGNYVHNITFAANPGTPHPDGFQTWDDAGKGGVARNTLFEKNLIWLPDRHPTSNEDCTGFMMQAAHDNTWKNNIIRCFNGIHLYLVPVPPSPFACNSKILNNIIIGDLGYEQSKGPSGIAINDADNVVIKNNIVCELPIKHIHWTNSTNIDSDYNCVFNSDLSAVDVEVEGPNDLIDIDPKLVALVGSDGAVDITGADEHLQSDSPCINAGVDLSGTVDDDFDGNSRPVGSAWDMGAFEFSGITILSVGAIGSEETFGGHLLHFHSKLYDKGREAILGGDIDWMNDTIKAVCVDSADYTLDLATHDFLNDIPSAAQVAISDALTGKSITLGVADANDLTIATVSGDEFEYIVLFKDTGDSATSPLIICIDNAVGLPFTPEGGSIKLKWSNLASKIFKL